MTSADTEIILVL